MYTMKITLCNNDIVMSVTIIIMVTLKKIYKITNTKYFHLKGW